MDNEDPVRRQVDQFISEQVESVPHLEALLLVWKRRPKSWTAAEMAGALYIPPEQAVAILRDLETRRLVEAETDGYVWRADNARDGLIGNVERIYRRELIRISNMIHSKASAAVREFARAFKLKKD
jgi:predicted ArsR family transcriptional regulator